MNVNRLRHADKKSKNTRLEKDLDYCVKDGSAYSVMSSFGDSYLGAFALALGATSSHIAMLTSLPSIASSFVQLFSSYVMKLRRHRKILVVAGAFLSAIMWLLMLMLGLFPMPLENAVLLVITFTILYSCFNAFINPIWTSWIGDLVPQNAIGRYFGKRNAILSAASFISTIAAGAILGYFQDLSQVAFGFAMLFFIAFIARVVSTYYLTQTSEPAFSASRIRVVWPHQMFRYPNRKIQVYMLFTSVFIFAVLIGSPFFVIYQLEVLKLNYLQFGFLLIIPLVVRYFASPYWGKMIDIFGSKLVLMCGTFITVINPLIYVFLPDYNWLIVAEIVSGFGWSAYELGAFGYMMRHSEVGDRTAITSNTNFFNGISRFFGSIIGGSLILHFSSSSAMFSELYAAVLAPVAVVILISGVLRLIVSLLFLFLLSDGNRDKMKETSKSILLLTIITPARNITHQVAHLPHYPIEMLRDHSRRRRR